MSDTLWVNEVARYSTLSAHERQRWLARFLFALTVFARETYTVGEDGLDDPRGMRRFNELMHRAASQLGDHIENSPGRPDEVFFQMAGEEIATLGIDFRSLTDVLRR